MCAQQFVAGNLQHKLTEWENIGASTTVLCWLREGVHIPFTSTPNSFILPNHKLSNEHKKFVTTEIQNLLRSGAIEHCINRPKCISPLGVVPKHNRQFRLIHDLRQVNSQCRSIGYQCEDIRNVASLIQSNDDLVSYDIKNGFHHVPVYKPHRDYLGFAWHGQFYRWRVLPFGLSCSSYYFSKVLRPVIEYLRQNQLRLSCYVDDILHMNSDDAIYGSTQLVQNTLSRLGYFINYDKSCTKPSKQITYLGYVINTVDVPSIRVTLTRCNKLKKDLRRVIKGDVVQARILARVAGQCVSMFRAIAPGKLMLRNVYRLLRTKANWTDSLALDSGTLSDLHWWLNALDGWNGNVLTKREPDIQIVTDASPIGFGATCMGQKASGFWTSFVGSMPQNAREMMAILMAIHSFAHILRNKTIHVVTDSITAMANINHMGGQSPLLTEITKAIWLAVQELDASITAGWLAGVQNIEADRLSRLSDKYEWALNPRIFRHINRVWGPHSIDRFATFTNSQLPVFNSRFWDPKTAGIDALAQIDWDVHNNYVNAPFRLLPRIIQKIKETRAWATVIAPLWPGQPWFQQMKTLVTQQPIRIPTSRLAIFKAIGHPEPLKNRRWRIFAWRLYGGLSSQTYTGQNVP